MVRKPSRPDSEIRALADEWRSRRRDGESVEAWMRRNVARLTRMVRDQGWRWDDVGRAMTLAGVTYSTGRAWTPEVLRVRASEARAQLRMRKMRVGEAVEETTAAPVPRPAGPPTPPPVPTQEPERPKFALAKIRENHPLPPQPAPKPQPDPAPAPAATHDAEAVHRQFFGRKNRPTTESSE